MVRRFSAPWGRSVKIVSTLFSALLLGLPLYALGGEHDLTLFFAVVVAPLAILFGALMFTVLGYEIDGDELHIQRLGWKHLISLKGLQRAVYKPNAMRRSLRLFGNGGLFSVSGLFKSKELGTYRAFVTDPEQTVVLNFDTRTVVISPGNPEKFVSTLNLTPATLPHD